MNSLALLKSTLAIEITTQCQLIHVDPWIGDKPSIILISVTSSLSIGDCALATRSRMRLLEGGMACEWLWEVGSGEWYIAHIAAALYLPACPLSLTRLRNSTTQLVVNRRHLTCIPIPMHTGRLIYRYPLLSIAGEGHVASPLLHHQPTRAHLDCYGKRDQRGGF